MAEVLEVLNPSIPLSRAVEICDEYQQKYSNLIVGFDLDNFAIVAEDAK